MRFLIYENYEDPWEIGLFFDDVITGQDGVTTVQFSMEVKILSWSFSKKKLWVDWTKQLLAELRYRHPTFWIQSSKKALIQKKIHKLDLFLH